MVGKILGNRYEIVAKLGSGGMAHVYQARCRILNRIVTVKILRAELAEDKEFVQRFRREAQTVASLSHPNVVSIYDIGEEAGIPYLVMEYVEGSNLKEIIEREGPLPPAEAANLGAQVCAALAHAHEKGIIHRDIKPHNILVTPAGRVKVTDFGLARVLSLPSATQSGSVMGSVHYFSPEQARGEEVGPKSDLYSLGVVLYEVVTGHVPFRGDNPISVALKHLQELPPAPSKENPAVPRWLEKIIFKAMAKDPRQRFASAREMQRALAEEFAPREDIEDENNNGELAHLTSGAPEGSPQRRFRPAAWLALFALLVLITAGSVWAASKWFFVRDVTVPPVTQIPLADAEAKIKALGLDPRAHEIYDPQVPAGIVLRQSPLAGTPVKKGRVVELWVSKGPRLVWLPDVTGYPLREAKAYLTNAGFQVKVEEVYDQDVPPQAIAGQVPAGDRRVTEGSEVTLRVSKGPPPGDLVMPSLIGLTVEQAREVLDSVGLGLGEIRDEASLDYPEGIIFGQSISQGTPVRPGDVVNVIRSKGPGPQQRLVPLELKVRDSGEVKVVVQDARGTRVVYQQFHQAGEKIKKEFLVFGAGEIQIYFQGQFFEKYSIE
ncbi:MAG: Stk1 family PASTA domain-containing Ser/Thr kinase [Firmicutes bacterium]|nr:Stk1 family PASTA domain-containing Ser/Thr kinase [Bacillota bacterium]